MTDLRLLLDEFIPQIIIVRYRFESRRETETMSVRREKFRSNSRTNRWRASSSAIVVISLAPPLQARMLDVSAPISLQANLCQSEAWRADISQRIQNQHESARAFRRRPFPASGARRSRNSFVRAHRLDETGVRAVPLEKEASVEHHQPRARAPRARRAPAGRRGHRSVACEISAWACRYGAALST